MKTRFLLLLFTMLAVGVFSQTVYYETVSDGDWTDANNWQYDDGSGWVTPPAAPSLTSNDEVYIYHQMTNVPATINVEGTLYVVNTINFNDVTGSGTIYLYYDSAPVDVSFDDIQIGTLYVDGSDIIDITIDGDWDVGAYLENTAGNNIEFIGNHSLLSANNFTTTNVLFTGNYTITRATTFGLEVEFIGTVNIGATCTFYDVSTFNDNTVINAGCTFTDVVTFSDDVTIGAGCTYTQGVIFGANVIINAANTFNHEITFPNNVSINQEGCIFQQKVNFLGISAINASATFNGMVDIVSGSITISNTSTSSFNGKVNITNGATFDLSTGSCNFGDPIYVSGQLVDNNVNGAININDSLIVKPVGTVNTSANVTVGNFIFNAASILNDGVFTAGSMRLNGPLSLSGSTGITVSSYLNIFSGTVTNSLSVASGGLTVNNNITGGISGTIILMNNGLITYKGTSAPMGSKTLTTTDVNSMFVYNGSATQTMKTTSYYNLKINNAAGVSLTGNITVMNNLDLTSGKVTPTNLALVLTINDNGTATNASSSSFIAGKCKKIGNDAFTFPVGKGNYFAPATITAPTLTTDAFTAEYFGVDPHTLYDVASRDVGLSQVSRKEYWFVARTTGTSSVDVSLTWYNPRSGTIVNINDLRVVHWDGSKWEDKGQNNISGDVNSGEIRSLTTSNFSPFTIGSSSDENPLPISLVSFDVFCDESSNTVSWQTASEENSNYFDLEASIDLNKWEIRATVDGSNNSNSIKSYQVNDPKAIIPFKYYRLRHFDLDGTYSYSQIINVQCSEMIEDKIEIYPVPAKDFVVISTSESLLGSKVLIYNSLNQLVDEIEINTISENFTIGNYSSGLYFVKVISSSNEILNHRFIVE